MANVQNYQCPACGGPLEFVATLGKLKCPYCDSVFSPDQIAETHSSDVQEEESNLLNPHGLKEYTCPSCNATIICEQNTAATSCPYCNNPTIVETQFKGSLKPDYIIPFKIEKKQAIASLKDFYKGKPLLPGKFASNNQLEEIKGVYVPFYFFDGKAHGSANFSAQTVQKKETEDEIITITRHYSCTRDGEMDFEMVPADASRQIEDDLMDSIEPYNYRELKNFSTGYLPGYLAEVKNVSEEECLNRVIPRCTETCLSEMQNTVSGYNSVSRSGNNIQFRKSAVHYGLLPVYLLNTKYQDKKYRYAVNGQTKKIVGSLPISGAKGFLRFLLTFIISTIIVAGVLIGASYLLEMDTSKEALLAYAAIAGVISLFVALGSLLIAISKMKTVYTAAEANNYAASRLKLHHRNDTFINETRSVQKKEKPRQYQR